MFPHPDESYTPDEARTPDNPVPPWRKPFFSLTWSFFLACLLFVFPSSTAHSAREQPASGERFARPEATSPVSPGASSRKASREEELLREEIHKGTEALWLEFLTREEALRKQLLEMDEKLQGNVLRKSRKLREKALEKTEALREKFLEENRALREKALEKTEALREKFLEEDRELREKALEETEEHRQEKLIKKREKLLKEQEKLRQEFPREQEKLRQEFLREQEELREELLEELRKIREKSLRKQGRYLRRGKILYAIESVDGKPRVKAEFLARVPVRKAWDDITDLEGLPEYLPGCTESRIIRRQGNRVIVKQRYSRMLGIFNQEITLVYTLDPQDRSLRWHLQEGPFSENTGSIRLEPVDEQTTGITYSFYYRPHSLVTDYLPQDTWIHMLRSKELPLIAEALKKAVER